MPQTISNGLQSLTNGYTNTHTPHTHNVKHKVDGFGTRAIHVGSDPDEATGAVIPAVSLSTTYKQYGVGIHKVSTKNFSVVTILNVWQGFEYSRSGNPNRNALESTLASLESGGAHALAFSSGSATTATILQSLGPGAHVLSVNDVYGGTRRYMTQVAAEQGLEVSFVDLEASAEETIVAAIQPNTKVHIPRLYFLQTSVLTVYTTVNLDRIPHQPDPAADRHLSHVQHRPFPPVQPTCPGRQHVPLPLLLLPPPPRRRHRHALPNQIHQRPLRRRHGRRHPPRTPNRLRQQTPLPPKRNRRRPERVRLLARAARSQDARAAHESARRERAARRPCAGGVPACEGGDISWTGEPSAACAGVCVVVAPCEEVDRLYCYTWGGRRGVSVWRDDFV